MVRYVPNEKRQNSKYKSKNIDGRLNIIKKMDENKLNGKIAVLNKQIEFEDDPKKKQELNNKLRVAHVEKQIASLRRQIEQLREK